MKINNNPMANNYQIKNKINENKVQNMRRSYQNYGDGEEDDQELKKAVNNFTSIFLNQMFKAMRSSLPEDKLIDGGYAEDVFTGMLDREISQKGSKQGTFSSLNKVLFRQLDQD